MAFQSSTQTGSVVGTWVGQQYFGIANYDATLVCNEDGTAHLTGTYDVLGSEGALNEDLTWSSLGNNQYNGAADGKTLDFTVSGNVLMAKVNLVALGLVDDSKLNINFGIMFTRQGSVINVFDLVTYYLYTVGCILGLN
jgi:hypothetical protein